MKIAFFVTVVALAVGALAVPGDGFAFCGVPGTTFTSNYYDAPPGFEDPLQTAGAFWGMGQFESGSPGGHDNGTAPSATWLRNLGTGFYLAGDWSGDPRYDGCIQDPPNPQPAQMAAAWTTSDGTRSYFVALCGTEELFGTFNTFLDIPGESMIEVPRPRILSSARIPGGNVQLTLMVPPAAGVHNTGGCSLAVTGVKVYTQLRSAVQPAPGGPGSRSPSAGWQLVASGLPGQPLFLPVQCSFDGRVYLMSTLVLDNAVELQQGSANALPILCNPLLAEPSDEGDFRFIRKPKGR